MNLSKPKFAWHDILNLMEERPLVSSLDSNPAPKNFSVLYLVLVLVVIAAGIFSGIFFARKSLSASASPSAVVTGASAVTPLSSGEVGSTNPAFKDTATGQLAAGGLNGEGTYHLVRPGGDSQTVYLVSSIVDLSQYVGKTVQVTGQTLKARHVGWLMDVGRLKIVQ